MSVFGQHDLLSIGHNVDLDMTLPFLLGPVPWSLSPPDRISTKTDESNFRMACNHTLNQHLIGHVVLHIHVTLMVMPYLQGIIAFPVTFKDLMAQVFNLALKAGHVGLVTDTYIQCICSTLKVLQTSSQRITWVFYSTMVYATKSAPSECQQHRPEYGGRDLQQYTV